MSISWLLYEAFNVFRRRADSLLGLHAFWNQKCFWILLFLLYGSIHSVVWVFPHLFLLFFGPFDSPLHIFNVFCWYCYFSPVSPSQLCDQVENLREKKQWAVLDVFRSQNKTSKTLQNLPRKRTPRSSRGSDKSRRTALGGFKRSAKGPKYWEISSFEGIGRVSGDQKQIQWLSFQQFISHQQVKWLKCLEINELEVVWILEGAWMKFERRLSDSMGLLLKKYSFRPSKDQFRIPEFPLCCLKRVV